VLELRHDERVRVASKLQTSNFELRKGPARAGPFFHLEAVTRTPSQKELERMPREVAYRKETFYNGLRALLEISRDGISRR
jgi:hypothetical protein